MPLPTVVKLGEYSVDLCLRGRSSFIKLSDSTAVKTEAGTLLWDPGTSGLLGGVGFQERDSEHQGERHLDGDELLYVIAGRVRLMLENDDGTLDAIPLAAGEAVLVPQNRWHRLKIDEAAHYISFGGGRTEIRP